MSYYHDAQKRAKRVKSPWNLLQLPLTIGGIAMTYWVFIQIDFLIIRIIRPDHPALNSYLSEDTREFIEIPFFFAAMPIGMMISNIVIWLIPPLRRIQEREAIGHKGTDFKGSMRGLGVFALIVIPVGFSISILVALFGR